MGVVSDQVILFCLLGVIFGLFIWGRIRYDLVAFGGLIIAVVIGVVPGEDAFSGFGHHATVIIALVLVVSRGLSNSGAIEWIARHVVDAGRSLFTHIGLMAGISAALSAVMNNVAALALLMPIDIQAAKKAGRSPALSLMPLSFASILGGMITLIGTPPNIIIASFREKAVGEPFGMFDFTPVGVVTAVVGIIFIIFVGWRLIPQPEQTRAADESRFNIDDYVAEVRVGDSATVVGKRVRDLDGQAEQDDVAIIGLVRKGKRLPGRARYEEIRRGDLIVIEADAEAIDTFVGALKLEYVGSEKYVGHADEGL